MSEIAAKRLSTIESVDPGLFAIPFGDPRKVRLVERIPQPGQIAFRGDIGDARLREGIRTALGLDLPVEPNHAATTVSAEALWLGPDEWLLVVPFELRTAVMADLTHALAGLDVAFVDVSAGRAILEIDGPHAGEVLEKGMPLDLHPRAFGPGRCAQSLLGRASVILQRPDSRLLYRLYARPSFSLYLAQWLMDAMAEFLD